MIFKTNHMFWYENESTGYRHVSVQYEDRILMAVTAHNVSGKWNAQVIPMGFSFSQDEVVAFSGLFSVLPALMEFMCSEQLTFEEMQDFLLTLQ